MRAVLFDLDGTLMDHDAARDAAIAELLSGDRALAGEWRRLEAIHYDEYAAGRCSFQEQRRRRVRGIHAAMGAEAPADAVCDEWFAAYLAAGAGLRGIWLDRGGTGPVPGGIVRVDSLRELAAAVTA
jgi:phosphoglycolate phosphatase-like HAD superfamily hydrolase